MPELASNELSTATSALRPQTRGRLPATSSPAAADNDSSAAVASGLRAGRGEPDDSTRAKRRPASDGFPDALAAVQTAFQAIPRTQPDLSPLLSQLNKSDGQARQQRDESSRQQDERPSTTDPELSHAAASTRNTLAAERSLDPASKAFQRREAIESTEQKIDAEQESFRDALARSTPPAESDATGENSQLTKPGGPPNLTAPQEPTGARSDQSAAVPPRVDETKQTRPTASSASDNAATAPRGPAQTPPSPAARPAASAPATETAKSASPSDSSQSQQYNSAASAEPAAGAVPALVAAIESASAPESVASEPAATRIDGANGLSTTSRNANPQRPAPPKTQPPETGDTRKTDEQIAQLVRVLRGRMTQDRSNITMRLDPASLGGIRISMALNKSDVALEIDTETHLAHRLLTDQSDDLRRALQESGINLQRIEVRPPADADPRTGSKGFEHGHNHANDRNDNSGAFAGGGQPDGNHRGGNSDGAAHGGRPDSADRSAERSRNDWEMESRPALASSEEARAAGPESTTGRAASKRSLNIWA